ncbi:hypothetical protein GCM10023187_35300 [Nibrella viscosa]|uniref:SnoaL-like domain-containing protein n=1 Tax=Nibrella viscosa TaxID=1084524 RepID=A0ABP8KMP3_9BACT
MRALLLLILLLSSGLSAYSQSTGEKSAESGNRASLSPSPEDLAQRQLNAYNARNIDAFLDPYADDVEIYDFPDQLRYKGKDTMRKQYGSMFERTKALHCELVNRIILGNTVIDHERVTFDPNQAPVQAIAIYRIVNGKIKKVYFTR